jgi:hypothetical protein
VSRAPGAPGSEARPGLPRSAPSRPQSSPSTVGSARSCAAAMRVGGEPRPRQPALASAAGPARSRALVHVHGQVSARAGACAGAAAHPSPYRRAGRGLVVCQVGAVGSAVALGRAEMAAESGLGDRKYRAAPSVRHEWQAARRSLAKRTATPPPAGKGVVVGAAAAVGRHDAKPGSPRAPRVSLLRRWHGAARVPRLPHRGVRRQFRRPAGRRGRCVSRPRPPGPAGRRSRWCGAAGRLKVPSW